MAGGVTAVENVAKVVAKAGPKAKLASKLTPKAGWNPANVLTVAAGVSTFGFTAIAALREILDKKQGVNISMLLGPTSAFFVGASALALASGGRFGAGRGAMMVQGASLGLIGAGAVTAVSGATGWFNPYHAEGGRDTDPSVRVRKYTPQLVTSPSQLQAMEVGVAIARTTKDGAGNETRIPLYVDPTTAEKLPDGTTLVQARREAQAAAQEDVPKQRSFAVIQSRDGAMWIARLTGQLDTIDGPHYGEGNSLDPTWVDWLRIEARHPSVVAVSGVENFPPYTPVKPRAAARDEGAPVVPELKKSADSRTAGAGKTAAADAGAEDGGDDS